MSDSYVIAVTSHTNTTSHRISSVTTIGRSECDVLVNEPGVSRSHATIEPRSDGCVLTDLESSNGTFVNNVRIAGPTLVSARDVIRLGANVSISIQDDTAPTSTAPGSPPQGRHTATIPRPVTEAQVSSRGGGGGDQVNSLERDNIDVRFIEQSAGRKAAKSMLDSARRARRKLEGFGNEADGTRVTIHLIDPLVHDGKLLSSGTIVDVATAQMWCVVSAESPVEDPTRAMALIFGGGFPGAAEFEPLIAGYGLYRSGQHDAPAADWSELEEPARTQTAAAFIHHLVEQTNDETVRELLASPPELLGSTARDLFGRPMEHLVRSWIAADASDYKSGQFLRLAFKHLWPYKLRQVEVFIYMLLSLAFTSVYPFVTRHLFDEVIPSQDFGRVWRLLLVLVIAFAVSLLAGVRRAYQSTFIAGSVVRDLRQEMFDRAQRLSSSSMRDYQQGEILSRMFQDVGQLQGGLSAMINTGIFQLVSLIVSGVIMLSVNLWLGLLVCVGAPIIAVVYRQMGEGAQKRSVAVQQKRAALMNVASENYQAGPVVKLFRLEDRESGRFRAAADQVIGSAQRMALFNGLFGLSVNFIMTLLQVSVLGIGAWMIFEGNFTLGGLVAFLGVMGEFLGPVTQLTTLGQTMQTSMGALKRVEEVTNAAVEPAGEDLGELPDVSTSIRLQNVSFSYTPERRTLDGLNVSIPVGMRTAFVGPSGSGKSTVLNVLMRLIEPDEGSLLIDGVDARSRSLSSWRRQIGVVFQDPFLFNISLSENIALGGDDPSPEQIQRAAESAEIDSFVDQLPDGMHSYVGEGGSLLSGGQRQRAAIARALVANPPVLVLDEATSALDSATERQINDTIDRAGGGRTVVSVTHRLTAITDYDLIVVMVDGRVEAQGTHSELLAHGQTYARLWAEQTGAPMPEPIRVDPVDALAELAPFRSTPRPELAELVESAAAVRLDTGSKTTISSGALMVLLSGRASVRKPDGAIQTLAAGDVIGVAGLLGEVEPSELHADQPVELLGLDAAAVAAFTQGHQTAGVEHATLVLPASSKALAPARARTDSPVMRPASAEPDIRATAILTRPSSATYDK